MLRPSLLASLLLCACTAPAPLASVEGSPPVEEDSGPTCTSSISESLVDANKPSGSGSALVLTEGYVAIGHIDAANLPTVSFASRADGAVKHVAVSRAIDARKYGAKSAALIFAHDRFGLAFTTERVSSDGTQSGLQAIAFATVDPATGAVSDALYANNELDRTGGGGRGGYVTARSPSVHPTAAGFLVAWEDFRTKEPVVTGINLFGWTGIYATAFDARGEPLASDGQIAQPTALLQTTQSIVSLPTSSRQLVAWLAYRDSRIVLHTHVGPANGRFEPWTPDAPELDLGTAKGRGLSMTAGGDGRHLAAIVAGDEFTDNTLYLQLLSPVGVPEGDRVKLDGKRLGAVSVAAHGDRYIVVAEELAPATYPHEDTLSGLRIVELGADGKVISDRVDPIALENVVSDGGPQLRVLDDRLEILLATRAARVDRSKPAKYETLSLRMVTSCR